MRAHHHEQGESPDEPTPAALDMLRTVLTDPDAMMEFAIRHCALFDGIDPAEVTSAVVVYRTSDPGLHVRIPIS